MHTTGTDAEVPRRPHARDSNWRARLLDALDDEAPLPELLSIVLLGFTQDEPVALFCASEPGAEWHCLATSPNAMPAPARKRIEEVLALWRSDGGSSGALLDALLTAALMPFALGAARTSALAGEAGILLMCSRADQSAAAAVQARLRRRARVAGWLCRREYARRAGDTMRRLFEAALTHAKAGVARYDTHAVIREVNEAFAEMLGYTPEDLQGRSCVDLLARQEETETVHANFERLLQGECDSLESRRLFRTSGGSEILVRLSTHLLRDRHGAAEAVVDVVTDISESEALNEALAYERAHDSLTGTFNRAAFEAQISARLRDEGAACMLAVVDLDRFGLLNASFGSHTGDLGLVRVAERLRAALHPGETVGRLGNDEFGLLLNVTDPAQAFAHAERLARLIEATPLSQEDGEPVRLTASIGMTSLEGSDTTQMLRQAEQAARRARDAGGNHVRLYQAGDPAYSEADRALAWAVRVQTALDEGRLTLVRQPIHALSPGGALSACEYLVRLVGRDGELVAPSEFLAAAERYAMAREIDRWVIDQALFRLGAEPQQLRQMEFASVNLSAQSLDDPDLGLYVLAALDQHGVPAEKFCLELTETAAVADIDAARALFRILRAAGCRFALDDFGSGMASFGYLRDLDVDFIKIDGRFVRNIAVNRVDRGMVEAMHGIARLTEKRTIAEFVEEPDALACLRDIGVDYAQGYAVGYPERLAPTI